MGNNSNVSPIQKHNNSNYHQNQLFPNIIEENDYQENNNKRNTYYYGLHKNKKILRNNPKYPKTNSQNKPNNSIKNYALLFLSKDYNNNIGSNNVNNNNNNLYNKPYYIKKYKNDDKYYRYGKKSNTIISNNINNTNNSKEKKKFYSTDIIGDKDKIKNIINENENNNLKRNRKNKSFKNEKSSQFVLLNNSFNKNLFNAFQDANNDKNNNHTINTIIGGNNNIFNDMRLTTINEPNINDNLTNNNNISNDYDNNLNIDNLSITQNSTIKYKNYNNTQTSFIYNKPQLLEQLKGYIDDDDEIKENNDNDINLTNITNDSNIYSSHINDNTDYKYVGNIIENKKEGIGKIIFKNKIVLISSFKNNKINESIIIFDNYKNIYKGYIKDNNFNGYCILNFNFNKHIRLKKLNDRKNNKIDIFKNNENDELINILNKYNNLFDFYLDLSDDNYNYSYIESYISNNNINDIGIIKWKNNATYVGEIKNGVKDGIGTFKWPDGTKYEGEFIKDRIEGLGQIYFIDGNVFRGQILNGIPHGYGEFIWNNDNKYCGSYINGKKDGFGIYIMISENLREYLTYFGFWKNGKQNGYGIVIKNKKIMYRKYKEGKKIKDYKYDYFIKEILPNINNKYNKVFSYDIKSLRKIINNIMYY